MICEGLSAAVDPLPFVAAAVRESQGAEAVPFLLFAVYVCMYIYIYIYRERERYIICIDIYIYIYIYMCCLLVLTPFVPFRRPLAALAVAGVRGAALEGARHDRPIDIIV